MTVLQTVPYIGNESSGPSYSVPGLCRGLQSAGCEVGLFFAGPRPSRSFTYPVTATPIRPFPTRRLGRSPELYRQLLSAAETADVIHNNSFWMFPNVYPYQVIQKLKRAGKKAPKLVNAPRGTLAAWSLKHHAFQKKLFGWFAGQYAAMRATDLWHATCEKEYEEIRAAGFKQPVAIVPIGMEVPGGSLKFEVGSLKFGVQSSELKVHRLVFFGRLHTVKRIDMLLRAWELLTSPHSNIPSFEQSNSKHQTSNIKHQTSNSKHQTSNIKLQTPNIKLQTSNIKLQTSNWELVIAGPDGGVRGELEIYVASHHLPRVRFVGEINGPAKYDFLTAADLYVLPSSTENFGITLAEALACGTPSLGSKGTPWSELNEWHCGSWGFDTAEELAAELAKLMALSDEERVAMGRRGQELIRTNYTWEGIGRKMKAAYEWLCHGGERPDWVKVD